MISEIFKNEKAAIFKDCLDNAKTEMDEKGVFFLKEEYISDLCRRFSLFKRIYPELVAGAKEIENNCEASLYALFLYKAMLKRKEFGDNLPMFTFPEGYEFLPLVCMLPFLEEIRDHHAARGVPDDVISATLDEFENCTFIYEKRSGKKGLSKRYFDFLQGYIDKKILNIGRLRFEIMTLEEPAALLREKSTGNLFIIMTSGSFDGCGLYSDTPPECREDFTVSGYIGTEGAEGNKVSSSGRCENSCGHFDFSEYTLIAKEGDTCLGVHIPDKGDFSKESCRKSYERAKEIFGRCFPELEIRAFNCESWMMAPELENHLKPDSRILSFASDYLKYPIHTKGEDVINFVFCLKGKTISELPEDSSLQKSLKKLYMSGKRLYEYGGMKEY